MQKQFQKFGLFISKGVNEETNDKVVKYLFKKDTEKSPKRKIKSANDAETHHKRNDIDDKYRKYRKKSRESISKKLKKKESTKNVQSETEIYFISPEEIKRHKKNLQKKREKSVDKFAEKKEKNVEHKAADKHAEKRKSLRKEEDIAKMIREHSPRLNFDKNDYPFLTKKDIFTLLTNLKDVPKPSGSTNFLKKFFVFDKPSSHEKKDFSQQIDKPQRKNHRSSEDNNNMIFVPFKDSADSTAKKLEKITKPREAEREQKKRSEKLKVKEKQPVDSVVKTTRKQRSKTKENSSNLVFNELQFSHGKVEEQKKPLPKKSYENSEPPKKSYTRKVKEKSEKPRISKADLERRLNNASRANPLRHRFCLVKSTFSVVSIEPTNDNAIEKKKKLKAFKKYYKYSRDKDSEITASSAYHTFSDSHKMYQDFSEHSFEDRKTSNNHRQKHKLQLETHISSVVISPKISYAYDVHFGNDTGTKWKGGNSHKSKIPVLNNNGKMIELANDSLSSPRSRQKSADLFAPKVRRDKLIEEDEDKSPPSSRSSSLEKPKRSNTPVQNKLELANDSNLSPKSRQRSADLFSSKARKENEEDVNIKSPPSTRSSSMGRSKRPTILANDSRQKSAAKTRREKEEDLKNKSPLSSRCSSVERPNRPNTPTQIKLRDKSPTPSYQRTPSLDRSKPSSVKSDVISKMSARSRIKEETLPHSSSKSPKSKPLNDNITSEDKKYQKVEKSSKNFSSKPGEANQFKTKSPLPVTNREVSSKTKDGRQQTATDPKRNQYLTEARQSRRDSELTNRSRNVSLSPPPPRRKQSSDNDGASAVWSKSSKRLQKSPIPSKSDTKLQKRTKSPVRKNEKSSTRSSVSNSTMESSKTGTSFFLTKTYKDDDKMNRWQKRKMYSDSLRRSLISKNQKSATIPPQVLEVRFLTVSNDDGKFIRTKEGKIHKSEPLFNDNIPSTSKEFFDEDLPTPYMEILDCDKFKEIFELPTDKALNDILSENVNFLKKDFSFTVNDVDGSSISEDDISTDDMYSPNHPKTNEWYNLPVAGAESITEIAFGRDKQLEISTKDLNLGSQDHIVDSLSAPGSEESGYSSTIKSRQISRSFFERPDIRALFDPPVETPPESYCVELEIEDNTSSSSAIQIRSIESKSLQATAEHSQKSVQIKMSQEEKTCQSEETKTVENTVTENDEGIIVPFLSGIDQWIEKSKMIFSQCSAHKKNSNSKKKNKTKKKRKFNLSFLSCISCVSSGE